MSKTSTTAQVAVTACATYDLDVLSEKLQRQVTLLGGWDQFVRPGSRVLLKPNLITATPSFRAATTHPAMIIATAKLLREHGVEVIVGDSPAWGTADGCMKMLGLQEPLAELGVSFVPLNQPQRCLIEGTKVGISRLALDVDHIINLPKLKSHGQLGATFAIKNMFGCVCGKEKAYWHFARGKDPSAFARLLIGIYRLLNPCLTIIDGVVGMEGSGPINGTPREVGFLIGSSDPVACELACCDLVNFDPQELPLLKTALELGWGPRDTNHIEFMGDDYRNHRCSDFQHAQRTPIRFTFRHVWRSVTKQMIIVARERLRKSRE